MLSAIAWLIILLGAARLLALGQGARDSDAGRRFRELPAAVVKSSLDIGRNARWHREGAYLRAAESFLIAVAVVGLAHGRAVFYGWQGWALLVCAWTAAGGTILWYFDRDFARKFGQRPDYLGTTSVIDQVTQAHNLADLDLVALFSGIIGWLLLAFFS